MNDTPDTDTEADDAGGPGDCSDILTPSVHARLAKCFRLTDEARGERQEKGRAECLQKS